MPKGSIASRARARWSPGDLKTLEVARKLKEDRVDAVPVRSSPLAPAPISRASSRRRTTIGEEFDEWIASAERAASLEAERPPTEFMSVTTLVKVRAWIRKWRARAAAHRPAPERCLVDVVPGTHVAVSRNRETVERAMRDPSTVRCAHLAGADPEGYFDDTRGGRWERPAAVRTVRVGRAGTPLAAKYALCRECHDRVQRRRVAATEKCRGCLVSLPKSAMGRAVGEDGAPVAPLCVFCAKMTGDSRSRRRVGPVRGGGPFALPAEDERDENAEAASPGLDVVAKRLHFASDSNQLARLPRGTATIVRTCEFLDDVDVPAIDTLLFRSTGDAGTRRIEMDARLATDARAPERRVVERPRRLEATTATRVETVVERSAVAISSVSTWVRARNGFRRAIGQRYPPPAAANWIEKSPQKASKNSSHETAVERI